jgi:hypothetical protein
MMALGGGVSGNAACTSAKLPAAALLLVVGLPDLSYLSSDRCIEHALCTELHLHEPVVSIGALEVCCCLSKWKLVRVGCRLII